MCSFRKVVSLRVSDTHSSGTLIFGAGAFEIGAPRNLSAGAKFEISALCFTQSALLSYSQSN